MPIPPDPITDRMSYPRTCGQAEADDGETGGKTDPDDRIATVGMLSAAGRSGRREESVGGTGISRQVSSENATSRIR